MKRSLLSTLTLAAATFAGWWGAMPLQAGTTNFFGTYTQNFDLVLSNSATAMPPGFTSMVIAGANSTYTAANPISTAGIASATADTQTLTLWNAGSAVASSGTTTFNVGCWDTLNDRALGTDPTGTAAQVIQLALTNTTGSTLAGVTFNYSCKCLTNGSAGTEQTELPGYAFFYSTTGTNAAANWTEVGVAGNVAGATNSAGVPIPNGLCLPNFTQGTTMTSGPVTITFVTPLTNNGVMYFRWADDNNQAISPDQMLAIDDIGIVGIPAAGPFLSLSSPTNGNNFIPGTNVIVTATVGDYSSTVTNVEFFANGTDLGGITNAPYSLTLSNLAIGSYALQAIASDLSGLSATSAVATITVAYVPPTVAITSPTNTAIFVPGSTVTLTATASSVDTTVTNVEFFANGTDLGGATSAPYSLTWPTVPVGSYALTAVASDALGLAKTSAVVNISLSYARPTVSLTSPAASAVFKSPATITLAATAAASDSAITNVNFFAGTTLLGNATTAPFTLSWSNVTAGAYSLTARAASGFGVVATSSVVSITVTNPLVTTFSGVYTQNFDLALSNGITTMPAGFQAMTIAGSHFTYTNAPGLLLNSNAIALAAGGSATLVAWTSGSAVTAAGSQLFNIGTWTNHNNRALGSDPTGTAATVIQLALTNVSGAPLAGVVFSYDELCLTNGSTSNGSYTDDGTERLELPGYEFFYSLTGGTVASNWYAVKALQMTNWVQGTETPSGPVTLTFPAPLPVGGVMYFRWADDNCVASSPDQMYAIDNISITSVAATGPLVSLTAPANGANYLPGTNVTLLATASEYNGTVTSVAFYAGSTLLGNVTTAPYSLTWTNPALGAYAITAVASDLVGLTATSSVANITVAYVAPAVAITAPAAGANFAPGSTLTLAATAGSVDSTVTNVEFYANGTDLGGSTTAPFGLTWPAVPAGSYALTAVATDALGLVSTSAVVNITLAYLPPTVSITSPATGSAYSAPATITVVATATDSDATITNVAFYAGATLLGNATTAPYAFTWANVPTGSYTVSAQAQDSVGASATASITLTVTNPLVASFTGVYTQNFDLALSNKSTILPAGFQAMYLPGSHFTYTNAPGLLLDSNAIVQAAVGSGASTLIVWPYGSAVTKASYQLFNVVGGFTSPTDCALGTDPTGTGGTVIQLALTNNTGGPLTGVYFSYTEKCMTNGSTSNGSYTDDGTESLELPGYEFFYNTSGDLNPTNWYQNYVLSATNWVQGTASNAGPVALTFNPPLTNGGVMYFRWADDNCVSSSPDQMYAIDNILITPLAPPLVQLDSGYYTGPGFFSGFNLVTTNTAGQTLNVWSTTNPNAPVSTWNLVSPLNEQALNDGSGNSRYSVNLNPAVTPAFYVIGQTNVGPFVSPAPLGWATTPDNVNYTFSTSLVPINTNGVFQLPLSITFNTPTNGQNFLPHTAVAISLTVTDALTAFTNVTLYLGNSPVYTFPGAPYYLPIPAGELPVGNYPLSVVGLDALGLSVTSSVVDITVAYVPPTVSLTSPVDGTGYPAAANIPLAAIAASPDATIASVTFYSGTNWLATVTNAPYTYTWNVVQAGYYGVTAVATDSQGLSSTSSVANIIVTNAYGLPVVTLTAPANNASYQPGASITLAATATEYGGSITNVEFFANATDLGGVTTSPYSLTWPAVPAGVYALTAVASDATGISSTSAVVNISVSTVHYPPTVSLTIPTNGAAINVASGLLLSATASSSSGTITNVAFYQNGFFVASVPNAPYTYNWTNAPSGLYTLTAVAKDNTGAATTASAISIIASNSTQIATIQQIKTVFVIPLENHDLVQANPTGSPQQLLGNPACPYFNSLITPGNPNAAQTAWATHYYSVAINGEHPSEPNYVWSEAGTDFGVRTDNDPTAGANQWSNVQHLTGQLLAAGIPWRNYEEDVEYSSGPTHSASGSGAVNPYNGTTQYSYACKHNPMCFFTDTQTKYVYPLTNLWTDLANNTVGRYNWITPDQYNEMHSALPSGFTYHGTAWTGDQAAIASGDNALSILIPKIMASQAYQDHGVIIIWTDETESTDNTNTTLPYVIISPLAKGNAYASTLPYSHSSDLKTMDELFGLPYQNNAIPSGNLDAQNTGYNAVNGSSAVINDLSDFFKAPAPVQIAGLTYPKQGSFQLNFSGPVGQTYEVLATTDLTLPQSAWTVVASGTFTGTNVVYTDTNSANMAGRYFVVQAP